MKENLPQTTNKSIILFPSIFRFITEYSFPNSHSRNIKIGLVSLFSLFLLSIIFLQGVVFWYHLQQREVMTQQREGLQKEVAYWQQVADTYQGYRDVYYRIAALEYQLGNIAASQEYVKKALELDPNFPEGRVLGAKVGL